MSQKQRNRLIQQRIQQHKEWESRTRLGSRIFGLLIWNLLLQIAIIFLLLIK